MGKKGLKDPLGVPIAFERNDRCPKLIAKKGLSTIVCVLKSIKISVNPKICSPLRVGPQVSKYMKKTIYPKSERRPVLTRY
jgi:hypothetical protein